jgi:hypothetical protein
VPAADGQGCLDGSADRSDILSVDGDEHVHAHPYAVHMRRVITVREAREELGSCVVVREVPRVVAAREDRPHRKEGMCDEDRLGDDDHRVGKEISAVARIEQERAVREDADRRDDHQEDHHG